MKMPLGLWIFSFFVMTIYIFVTFLFWFPHKPKWERDILYVMNAMPIGLLFLLDENIFFISILSMGFNAFYKIVNFPKKTPFGFKYNNLMIIVCETFQLVVIAVLICFYFYVQPKIGAEQFWQPSP